MRKLAIMIAACTLTLGLAGEASAADLSGLDTRQVIRIVGHRFIVRTHVSGASYNGKKHIVNGTVDMTNKADRGRRANCEVVLTFQAKHGKAKRKRSDDFRVHVGANDSRSEDFLVKLRDEAGRFQNDPVHQVTHCHTPYRN